MEERDFLLAIQLTTGLGLARKAQIIKGIEEKRAPTGYPWSEMTLAVIVGLDPTSQIFARIAGAYRAALRRVEEQRGVFSYFTYFDDAYPEQLRQIFQPPLILFYRGDLRALRLPALAVVGTRTATPYGFSCLRRLLPGVIEHGVAIVSGLARGIDVMAHQVTFSNRGVPVAVIGSGLNHAYPVRNRQLQEEVALQGLLLSEYPDDVPSHRGHFPERNRIIAGLASATMVVEAKQHSGSLITANSALQNNRNVLAVPGSIFSDESSGCHELIQAGATVVQSSSDILANLSGF
ncbi:DNA-processing protein DprA [Fructobacillus fructosus]|uniref:DNA-processing protein DprA n=1 Tax=Fructobacillus fructosus TaxID=1631 RepID=UPI00200B7441|nr:DNA-processing protein DprA [Fructobacillus fructosus]MCK8638347.1 DNA-processing protein DprA [Fructobacillus fructosus]